MARRMEPSPSRSMASRARAVMEYGKETGLPLVVCPTCHRERVLELVVKVEENGNQGRVFFKCPRNVRGMPGRCTFYEFQKLYLKKLIELKYVSINVEAGLQVQGVVVGEEEWEGFAEEEAQSLYVAKVGKKKNSMELQMQSIESLLKMLVGAMFFGCFVGVLCVLKK